MMSSNVALLHSNNCCVLEPAICEDLDLHVAIFSSVLVGTNHFVLQNKRDLAGFRLNLSKLALRLERSKISLDKCHFEIVLKF